MESDSDPSRTASSLGPGGLRLGQESSLEGLGGLSQGLRAGLGREGRHMRSRLLHPDWSRPKVVQGWEPG